MTRIPSEEIGCSGVCVKRRSRYSPHGAIARGKTFYRQRSRFGCFDVAIARGRIRYQRSEEVMCHVRDVIYRAIEGAFIRA